MKETTKNYRFIKGVLKNIQKGTGRSNGHKIYQLFVAERIAYKDLEEKLKPTAIHLR